MAVDTLGPLLVISDKGVLEKQFVEEEHRWFREHLLVPQLKSWGSQPWGADARKFCESALAATEEEGARGPAICALAAPADKLMAAGCKDPLVCYLAHTAHANWREGEAALDRAIEHMSDPGTKGALMARIAYAKIQMESALGFSSPAFFSKMIEGLKLSLTDGSYDLASLQTLLRQHRHCLDKIQYADLNLILGMKEAYEKSTIPDWLKLTLQGGLDIELAWKARGSGWAQTVTPPGWQGFGERLKNAHEELEHAWTLHPASPDAALLMITVTMGQGGSLEELQKWFDRATTAEFDLPSAYFKTSYAFEPRWGGSYDLMLRFGLACVRTQRFDTEVPAVLWKVCEFVGRETTDAQRLYSNEAIRAALQAVQEGYLARQSSSDAAALKRHASMAAVAAHFMGDLTSANKALAVAGPALDAKAVSYLKSQGQSETRMRLENRVARGEFGSELAALIDRAAAKNGPEFKSRLAAIKEAALAPEAAGYVEDMRFLMEFGDRFDKGAWIAVAFHPGLSLFDQTGAKCSTTPNGDLVMDGDDDQGFAEVVLRAPVPGDCEIKGEFEVVIPKDLKKRKMTMFGPVVGFQFSPMPENPLPVTRGLVLISSVVYQVEGQITGGPFLNRRPRPSMPLKKTNKFHLGIHDGKATFDMSGAPFATHDALSNIGVTNSAGMAGFCVRNIPVGGKIIVRHLEIRKSTAAALDVMK